MNQAAGPPPIHRQAAWAFAGQGCFLVCQWLLLTAFARLGGADAVGLYALALVVTGPVIVLANLSLRELLLSDTAGRFRFQDYLGLRLMAMGAALVVIAGICLAMGWSAMRTTTVVALGTAKVLESLADLGNSAAQAHGRFAGPALSQAVRGIVGLLLAGGVFWYGGGVDEAIIALLGGSLVVLVALDLPRIARIPGIGPLSPRLDPAAVRPLAGLALPLGLAALIGSLLLTLPSYVIEGTRGTAELGRYATLTYLLLPGNLLMMALGQAASPRLARLLEAGDLPGFRALTWTLCAIALGVALVAVVACSLLGGTLLALVLGDGWRPEAPVLWWLSLASGAYWVACALGVATTAARRLKPQLPLTVAGCAAALASALLLIPSHGSIGAAWSSIIANVVLVAGLLWMVTTVRRPMTAQAAP